MDTIDSKVFISYCWSTPEHESFVIGLAEDLVSSGVDVVIDKWDLKDGQDSLSFMESMVNDDSIKKVLIISDKSYADKANNRKGGVGTETQIISPEIYASAKQTRFVVVTTQKDEEGHHYVPTFYKGRIFIDMTDSSLHTEGFDKILRWIYDKPVYVKPELGKKPSFLDENKYTVLGTSSYCSRAMDAIRGGKSTSLGCFDEYLSTLTTNLERLRYKFTREDDSDEEFLKNIDEFIPSRNEFINLVSLVARYNLGVDFSKRLHSFFQDAIVYYYTPENIRSYNDYDYDNYKFIIHELYLYSVAIYLKSERFDDCSILFENFYIPIKIRFGDKPLTDYTTVQQHIGIFEWRNQHRNLGRLSLHADKLKERCHSLPVNFTDINQADFVCYVKSVSMLTSIYPSWWPVTLLYVRSRHPFEIFAKATSKIYFDKIKKLIGFLNAQDLLASMSALENSDSAPRWQFERISPLALSNATAISNNI